ncbi:MAG: peptide deformylase [Ruminococcus callidus]
MLEGCLSVPNKWGYVTRPNKCKFRAQNRKGEWYEMTLSDWEHSASAMKTLIWTDSCSLMW